MRRTKDPVIHICKCGMAFFEEEGREYETLCNDCQDPYWRKDD